MDSLTPSASSPSRQCSCATRWNVVVIGSCCCSPFRALSDLSTASFRGLGRLAWSRQFGQQLPCGAGSRRHISDFCFDPPGCWRNGPRSRMSLGLRAARPKIGASAYLNELMKHPGKQRSMCRFACDRERNCAPIPREAITACLFGAPASYSVCFRAKVGNQRIGCG
jgi:hypothetical protein